MTFDPTLPTCVALRPRMRAAAASIFSRRADPSCSRSVSGLELYRFPYPHLTRASNVADVFFVKGVMSETYGGTDCNGRLPESVRFRTNSSVRSSHRLEIPCI